MNHMYALIFTAGLESKICKHFLTHGCRLGTKCRFLHCSAEDLANKMNVNDQNSIRGFRGGHGNRGRGRGAPWGRGGHFVPSQTPPSLNERSEVVTEKMDTLEPAKQMDTLEQSNVVNSDSITNSSDKQVELNSEGGE